MTTEVGWTEADGEWQLKEREEEGRGPGRHMGAMSRNQGNAPNNFLRLLGARDREKFH